MTTAVVRQRRNTSIGEKAVMESLLDDEAPPQPSAKRDVIPYTGPFNLQKFLVYVVQSWQGIVTTLQSYIRGVVGAKPEFTLTPVQAERLARLRESIAVQYDGTNVEHQKALRALWALGFPHIPCTVLKTPQWKDMGWQGDDPGTDFRGAGLYGLENLIYLGTQHPAAFSQLMHKTQGTRAEWEYPFAVAGLNITFMLVDLLDLQDAQRPPQSSAGQAFLTLLEQDEHAFEEVYCITFLALDKVWLELKASYMQFSSVMGQAKARVERALSSKPASLAELRGRVLGAR